MLIIRVHLDHADDVECAFKEWHDGLLPIEWQDVAALERMLRDEDITAGGDASPHVRFRVEQRFIVFLKDRELLFEEVSVGDGEAGD